MRLCSVSWQKVELMSLARGGGAEGLLVLILHSPSKQFRNSWKLLSTSCSAAQGLTWDKQKRSFAINLGNLEPQFKFCVNTLPLVCFSLSRHKRGEAKFWVFLSCKGFLYTPPLGKCVDF